MCVLEEHRPALWFRGRIEYKLNGNRVNLHSGCVIEAVWEDKWEIKVSIRDSYCRASNNNIFQSSFRVGKHGAYVVSLDS